MVRDISTSALPGANKPSRVIGCGSVFSVVFITLALLPIDFQADLYQNTTCTCTYKDKNNPHHKTTCIDAPHTQWHLMTFF